MTSPQDFLQFSLGFTLFALSVLLEERSVRPFRRQPTFWPALALLPLAVASFLAVGSGFWLAPATASAAGRALAAIALLLTLPPAWQLRQRGRLSGGRLSIVIPCALTWGEAARLLWVPGVLLPLWLANLVAVAALEAVWTVFHRPPPGDGPERREHYRWLVPLFGLLLLGAGAWLTEIGGRAEQTDQYHRLLTQTESIAQFVHHDQLTPLAFAPKDVTRAHAQRLQTQLTQLARELGLRRIVSFSLQNGEVIGGPDSLGRSAQPPAARPAAIPPGLLRAVREVFRTGRSTIVVSGQGSGPRLVSGLAPILDPDGEVVRMVIEVETDAAPLLRNIAGSRLVPILFSAAMIGVLLGGVVVMRRRRWSPAGRSWWLRHIEGILTGICGLILTLALGLTTYQSGKANRTLTFGQLADTQAARISEAMRDIRDYQVTGMIRFFDSSDNVSRGDFRVYTLPMTSSPVIHGIGWAPWVDTGDPVMVGVILRLQGMTELPVYRRNPAGELFRVSQPIIGYPMLYAEADGQSFFPPGYDMGTDPACCEAIDEAVHTGLITATDPIQFPGDPSPMNVLIAPIFATVIEADRPGRPSADGHPLRGILVVTVHLDAMLRETFSESQANPEQGTLALHLLRLQDGRRPVQIANWPAEPTGLHPQSDRLLTGAHPDLANTYPLNIGGRTCLLTIHAGPGFRATDPRLAAWIVTLAGTLLAVILALFVGTLSRRRLVLEQAVGERTRELQASETRFRTLFENALTGIALHRLVYDGEGRPVDYVYLSVNPVFEQWTGLKVNEILDRRGSSLFPADEGAPFLPVYARVVTRHEPETVEGILKTLQRHFLVHAYWMGDDLFATVFLDITERHQAERARLQLEEQLQQARRLESVGYLAGGVAHDLNNLLTPIQGYAELILQSMPAQETPQRFLQHIIQASTRARDLVRQLLAVARKQTLEMRALDLNRVIEGFSSILRHTIRENVAIEQRLAPGLAPLDGDAGQLEQAVLHLAIFAQDAMPDGGTLTIETRPVPAQGNTPAQIALRIGDTGTGIDEESLAHLFDPFFATRKQGLRTGLGLATVYGIVQQHKGRIEVRSEAGRGTTFQVFFPAGGRIPEATTEPGAGRSLTGHETILIAEDQEQVRAMVSTILQKRGYQVLEADSGETALEKAAAHAEKIDLLVTDVIMTGIDGRTLYQRLRAARPAVRVLFMSGYSENVIEHHGVLDAGIAFIAKPFSIDELARRVRDVLDRDEGGKTS